MNPTWLFGVALTAVVSSAALGAQAARPGAARPTPRPPVKAPARPAKAPPPKAPAAAPEPPKRIPPDLQLTAIHSTGETRTTSTVQMKGPRTRINVGENLVSIQQCDTGVTTQLNSQTRTFISVPFATSDAAEPASKSDAKRKGGEVTYTTVVTDTGEKQTMFGLSARRLKTTVSKDFSLTACDKKPQRVDTDGWYIELPAALSCATVPRKEVTIQVDPQRPDCSDEVRYLPVPSPLGYPLKYTSVSTSGDDPPLTTTMEVSQFERTDIATSLVEVPADYLEVRTVSQLTADHRPGEPGEKKPGTVRLGLTPIGNKSAVQLQSSALNDALLESFSDTEIDVVRLAGSTPAELEADARSKQVDFLLNSTITEVKVPRGGIVGRVSGTSGDAFTARVDYSLVAPGQPKPTHTGSERSGGSTLNSAISLAKRLAQFAPPVMMAKYGYMNAYGSMLNGNGPPGAMKQSPDPVMNMAFSLLDRVAPSQPAEQFTEEGAVASALEKEIRSVVEELAKKKK